MELLRDRNFFNLKPSWAKFFGPFENSYVEYAGKDFLVAYLDEEAVAYIVWEFSEDDDLGKGLYIDYIEVNEHYQQQGIGKRLFYKVLKKVVEEDPTINFVELCASYSAIGFYEKLGFEIERDIPQQNKRYMLKRL